MRLQRNHSAPPVGYTKRDIEISECPSLPFAAGATANDIVQVSYGYGLVHWRPRRHYGAERLGATVIPMSGGSTKRQVQLMRLRATVLCCTPFLRPASQRCGLEIGINIKDLALRLGVFGAEPWTEEMRREIEDKLGITATNIYGLSEIRARRFPVLRQGTAWYVHLGRPFLPEIIDRHRAVLPEGSTGELVNTTLTK